MKTRSSIFECRTYTLLKMLFAAVMLAGCGFWRIDPYHYLIRSDTIDSPEKHDAVVAKAKLTWTSDNRIRVLFLRGTPYERGYQHGVLLRHEIQDNLGEMYKNAIKTYHYEELFEEVYERMRPYMPAEYVEEMHGLAHGAKVPLKMVHYLHILPEMTEWGGKDRLKKILHDMMRGAIVPSCSNLACNNSATPDKGHLAVRILDWGLHKVSKLHQYPLITVSVPDKGFASANIGWVGFIGAVSGMNDQGITLGEMGNGDTPNETLRGKAMPFLLRDVMTYSKSLADVRKIISSSPGTCSYGFLMTDGKTGESELYVRDPDRFLVFKPGESLHDYRKNLPGIKDTVYAGHFDDKMHELLSKNQGHITPELLMKEIIPQIAMKSNFQNVVYQPKTLQFWVANAASKTQAAWTQPYSFFDFGTALRDYQKSFSKP
jgi:isopenicillin-N N-acyltransferase-like protein